VSDIPFKTFINWAFDGSLDTPIPKPEVDSGGNVITPDILKSSGPLNQRYVVSMFMKNPKICLYLNKHFNNMGLWYLDKETLFKFLKRCIIDFKMKRGDLLFMKSIKRDKEKLVEKLEEKFPLLKHGDLQLLSKIIDESDQKDSIYHSFGLKRISKRKVKKEKKIKKTSAKTSSKNFIKKNFEIIDN
jgi:hypothetical protein